MNESPKLSPTEVDPWRFCKDGQSWEIRSDVAAFPRLADEFTQGTLLCRVLGRVNQRGSLSLQLAVSGEVKMTCQRCLNGMPYTVDLERTLYLARNEAEMERLDALPGSDAIQAGETLSLVELVEDEVLLSLPVAVMHAEGKCPV
ncbi:MAG: hypothetical protein A2580_02495 [Hydrogenophilales bacterium RIFOXYD1_FULL_62_11]|nr:MAG: hypothetical protein A2580_02495 [Hydrogenophilales bacterium RIFOXYD1_FULL_62_11]